MQVTYIGNARLKQLTAESGMSVSLCSRNIESLAPSHNAGMSNVTLDLNEYCIENPSATYYLRVQGESMKDAGIFDGDILIVDRSLTAEHNQIVIACVDGGMTVKVLELKDNIVLHPRNKAYKPIKITESTDFELFGVVVGVVRKLSRGLAQ